MDRKGIWSEKDEFGKLQVFLDIEEEAKKDLRYRTLVRQVGTMVFEWKPGVLYIDPKIVKEIAGIYNERHIFQIWLEDEIVHREDRKILLQLWKDSIAEEGDYIADIRLLSREEYFRWYRVSLSSILKENRIGHIIGSLLDISEGMRIDGNVPFRAENDAVTKIYNEPTLLARMKMLLGQNPDKNYAVIRLDVYKFKYINDRYGMQFGDELLKYIAHCIIKTTPRNGTFGRLGGDIFGIMIEYHVQEDVTQFIDLLDYEIKQYQIGFKISIYYGIYLVESEVESISAMFDRANLALQTVKGNHIQKYAFYDEKIRAKQLEEQWIEEEMEDALREGQFIIYMQPKYSMVTNSIIGAEVLVRWQHPREGFLAPDRFIPLFEKNEFIIQLDEHVWEETCIAMRRWLDRGYQPVPISINVSRSHIYDNRFENRLVEMIDYYHLPSHLIELELTESIFVEESEQLYKRLIRLQQKGFLFSMDDFGAGYSSLNMLKSAPVNILKLDRGFLNDTSATERGRIIVEYVVAMAKRLKLDIIAEGVETEEQVHFLRDIGCSYAQGYYYAKPMPVEEFERLAFWAQ